MNEPMHRSFVVVDVESSGALGNPELVTMRSTLYRIVREAVSRTEAPVSQEDRGDGCMLIFALPVLDVLDRIVEELFDGVREHNRTVDSVSWLRLRVAVSEGYVHRDNEGWTSDALTATFRLNDSPVVKQTLKSAARAHGVLVTSDAVYQSVIRHNYRGSLAPGEYHSAVIGTKEGEVRIWVRVPGYPKPPLPDVTPPTNRSDRADADRLARTSGGVNVGNMFAGDVRADMIVGGNNYGGAT